MTFQRSCLYHPTDGMRVIEADQEDIYNQLLETGVWFDHPNKAKDMRIKYEEQIRRGSRKGRRNAECETKEI